MNSHLVIHNTLSALSSLSMIILIIFLLFHNKGLVSRTLILTAISVLIFEISHLIGVNTPYGSFSRVVFIFNISVMYISLFNYHCVLASIKKHNKKRILIIFLYILTFILTILFIYSPDSFLLDSVPKLYFPNYYVPGPLYLTMVVMYQILTPLLFTYELIHSYIHENSILERKRIKWLAVSLILGWTVGQISTFLVYDIPIDPMYGIFFPILFCIPFTYAVINHDLLDIKIVAKRAFYYGILVTICALILIFLNFLNKWAEELIPGIPIWVVPLLSSIFAVAIGIAVWRRVREADILKYEFITKTMHELRTPLTHIKIATDNLEETNLDDTQRKNIGHIKNAEDKLIELTELVEKYY